MLGLAQSLPSTIRTVFWSFEESGKSKPFLEAAESLGFEAVCLENNAPQYHRVVSELRRRLRDLRPDVLFCHGYKADILGGIAARSLKIPVVAVSRGWTGASLKVKLNEMVDRFGLVGMDRVVCVSEGQAEKVRRAGVPSRRVVVIRNAIFAHRFDQPDPADRQALVKLFPQPPRLIVGAAGRLSPEKGFDVLISAAAIIARHNPSVGFVVFGEGPLRESLKCRIESEGLAGHFILAPFSNDLDRLIPQFDLMVLPSYTEGLPNVALEAAAASVAIVATDVGGTPEVLEDGVTGYLVPPGDPIALAVKVDELLSNADLRATMGRRGRQRVKDCFTFESQASAYVSLIKQLAKPKSRSERVLAGAVSD